MILPATIKAATRAVLRCGTIHQFLPLLLWYLENRAPPDCILALWRRFGAIHTSDRKGVKLNTPEGRTLLHLDRW